MEVLFVTVLQKNKMFYLCSVFRCVIFLRECLLYLQKNNKQIKQIIYLIISISIY